MQKQIGKAPPELANQPDPPPSLLYLWNYFCELGDFSYTELHHWATMKRVSLSAWEVDVLRRLDRIRMEVWRDRNSPSGSGR